MLYWAALEPFSPFEPGSRSYLAMSSGLRRKWRNTMLVLRTLRGTGAEGGAVGAVSLLLFLVSFPS